MKHWFKLRQHFLAAWPPAASQVGVVVGCSGGADSVALARLIVDHHRACFPEARTRKPPLIIAHYNHVMRGEHSDGDEQFVRQLCDQWRVTFAVGRSRDGQSRDSEADLRQERYAFLHDVAARSGCRYITLAHTADDQCETILHHLFRGTGTAGMTGIPITRPMGSDFVIRRPLLYTHRDDIVTGLREIGQTWREDASNQETRYTRNWIRHDVLPVVRERFPRADAALLRVAENHAQIGAMLSRLAQEWVEAFTLRTPINAVHLESAPDAQSITFLRPGTIAADVQPIHTRAWPHSIDLANELPIIIAACQYVYNLLGWSCGEMNREHWLRLATAIATTDEDGQTRQPYVVTEQPLISLGNWPGRVQAFQSRGSVTLQRVSRNGSTDSPGSRLETES